MSQWKEDVPVSKNINTIKVKNPDGRKSDFIEEVVDFAWEGAD